MTALTRQRPVHERTATFLRSWPSAAAWGAGLVQAALGAGAIVAVDTSLAARLLGSVLVALGLALLVWGALTLARGRTVAPRVPLILALAGVLLSTALLVSAPGRTSVSAAAIGVALLLVVGAHAAVALRRGSDPAAGPRPVGLTGLFVAAAIIAVLVTPALGAVQNAVLADDRGVVPVIDHH